MLVGKEFVACVKVLVNRDFMILPKKFNIKSKLLPSPFLVNKVAPISVSLAFGPHNCVSTMHATVGGWPSGGTVWFTPMLFPNVLNSKQGNSMGNFSVFRTTQLGIKPRPTAYKAGTGSQTWHLIYCHI